MQTDTAENFDFTDVLGFRHADARQRKLLRCNNFDKKNPKLMGFGLNPPLRREVEETREIGCELRFHRSVTKV